LLKLVNNPKSRDEIMKNYEILSACPVFVAPKICTLDDG